MDVNIGHKYELPAGSGNYPTTTEVFFDSTEDREMDRLIATIESDRSITRIIEVSESRVVLLGHFQPGSIKAYTKPKVLGSVVVKPSPKYL